MPDFWAEWTEFFLKVKGELVHELNCLRHAWNGPGTEPIEGNDGSGPNVELTYSEWVGST